MTSIEPARRTAVGAVGIAAIALAVAACAGSTTPSAIASAVTNASLPPVATEAPTEPASVPASEATATDEPSESALPSAVATDIDPCQLITADEAGALAGVKFGAGKTSTVPGGVTMCAYAAPGPNLFSVEVAVAPDEATAKAAEAQAEQDLKNQGSKLGQLGLKVTELPGFADGTDAAILEGSLKSPIAADARAMFLLRGVTFVGFSDLAVGGQAPSADAMKNQATTVLGKLP